MNDFYATPEQIEHILDENQAQEIVMIDVKEKTALMDFMVIASARSSRHVKALSDKLIETMKAQGVLTRRVHGLPQADWALIDFGNCVVHIMLPEIRAFYHLEELWQKARE